MMVKMLLAGCTILVLALSGCNLADPYLITVHRSSGAYEVSNLASEVYMWFPMKGYIRERPAEGPKESAYFYFSDKGRGIILSGWIVSGDGYPGKEAVWEETVANWRKRGVPEPLNVVQVRVDDWDGTLYDDAVPSGTCSHLRAHWVKYGTWVDVHLSITSNLPTEECRAKLIEELKGILFVKRH